ncbi:Tm-1-like ATP-binding domain-containing protein [Amaricoccus sp.]|uniref:Tm-1-like ATP-binding domain-containing protein n=1 Tax=Amaricoccus sp. TaxID=1872485 RepID=UPI002621EF28|nr:Tm-1-like ATP-binding domain-containing protein [Amaricoccus sp.]HRO12526.1 Tm-1-like ATP-binding domain-containing protein [Amaricoccus sp.]
MGHIYVVGTADTKGEELAFLAERIRAAGGAPLVVDVGIRAPTIVPDIPAPAIPPTEDRGTAVTAMAAALAAWLPTRRDLDAVVGIGGGGGTAIVTAAMRALPFGVPKLMVSTLASGDVGPYVGVSDITMMHPVADMAGLNRITRTVLAQAAAAVTAMARTPAATTTKPAVGLTMFGVTTPCVTRVADALRADRDPLVFHATGTGGRALEMLAGSGMLEGFVDATTTEVADEIVGGVLTAGPDRLGVLARTGLPWVGAPGALDMVNFWAPETVPARFAGRLFHRHNANITLMRTTPDECRRIAGFIAAKLNAATGPVRLLIPERGVSALDVAGGPFHDPAASAALFDTLEAEIAATPDRRVERLPLHINDPAFADALVAAYRSITEG